MSAKVFDIARRYVIEGLEEANVAVLRGLVHRDIVRRGPMGEVRGVASLEAQIQDDRFSDVCIVIDDIIATDEQAVIQYTWHGIHRGELFNIAATERRLILPVVEILRIEGERITAAEHYFDVYSLFEQIGMLPQPHQLAPPRVTRPVLRLVR